MLASLNRRRWRAALAFAGGVARPWQDWGKRLAVFAAGGVILWLGSSCASPGRKSPGDKSAPPPTPAPAAGAANTGGAENTAPTATMGRFVTSAHVDNDDAAGEAPSPGRDLLAHALAGAAGANPAEARAETGREGNGVPTAAAERRVGIVRVIGARGKFVLIETTNGVIGGTLAEGQELRCRGAATTGGAQTAVLKVARERQAPFLVADVVSGEPQAGDIAYFALEKRNETPPPR